MTYLLAHTCISRIQVLVLYSSRYNAAPFVSFIFIIWDASQIVFPKRKHTTLHSLSHIVWGSKNTSSSIFTDPTVSFCRSPLVFRIFFKFYLLLSLFVGEESFHWSHVDLGVVFNPVFFFEYSSVIFYEYHHYYYCYCYNSCCCCRRKKTTSFLILDDTAVTYSALRRAVASVRNKHNPNVYVHRLLPVSMLLVYPVI